MSQVAVFNDISKDTCLYTRSNTNTNNSNNDYTYDNCHSKDRTSEASGARIYHGEGNGRKAEHAVGPEEDPTAEIARARLNDVYVSITCKLPVAPSGVVTFKRTGR